MAIIDLNKDHSTDDEDIKELAKTVLAQGEFVGLSCSVNRKERKYRVYFAYEITEEQLKDADFYIEEPVPF